MPWIDLSQIGPKFLMPHLLTHHQIPRALSGVAPRNIMGNEWWDTERRKAYAGNDYHCWACGEATRLEAHEVYHIIYSLGKMFFIGVAALCPDCHSFIHCGRLARLLREGSLPLREYKRVMLRGHKLLKKASLSPSWSFRASLAMSITEFPFTNRKWVTELLKYITREANKPPKQAPWGVWRMVFQNKEYPSRYASMRQYESEAYK